MFAYASNLVVLVLSPLVGLLRRPDVAIALGYAAGLMADRSVADGAAAQPLFLLAAPAVVGLILRLNRGLRATDALGLVAVHLIVSAFAGDAPGVFATGLAQNLVWIAGATLVFGALRSSGFISSQRRTAAAVVIVTAAAAAAAAAVGLATAAGAEHGVAAALISWLASAVGSGLLLMVILAFDRDDAPVGLDETEEQERLPGALEHAGAVALVAGLTICSISTGLQEAALAASVGLLWFALRLGLFPTALGAFSFATTLLVFGDAVQWPGAPGAVEAEILRYAVIALLASPCVLVAAAVHDHRRARRIYAHRAMHDGLTQLANRSRFLEVLERAGEAAGARGRRFVLLLIDLDNFKLVNDTFGHVRGDALLVEIAERLRGSIRATDIVARIGGDEFAVVAPVRTVDDAKCLAKRLVETVHQVCDLEGVAYIPSITVGGVLAPDSACEPQKLMLLADEALYLAKAAGRNCWRFTTADETEEAPALPAWGFGGAETATETVYLD